MEIRFNKKSPEGMSLLVMELDMRGAKWSTYSKNDHIVVVFDVDDNTAMLLKLKYQQ